MRGGRKRVDCGGREERGVLELTNNSAREKLLLPEQYFSSIPFLSLRSEGHPRLHKL